MQELATLSAPGEHLGHSERSLLTTEEVAAQLSVSRRMVHKLARGGRLPFIQYSDRGRLRFRREDVAELLEPRRGSAA